MLLKLLALSNDSIISFKRSKSMYEFIDRKPKLNKIPRIKFLGYFIISFLFLLVLFDFIWSYI